MLFCAKQLRPAKRCTYRSSLVRPCSPQGECRANGVSSELWAGTKLCLKQPGHGSWHGLWTEAVCSWLGVGVNLWTEVEAQISASFEEASCSLPIRFLQRGTAWVQFVTICSSKQGHVIITLGKYLSLSH